MYFVGEKYLYLWMRVYLCIWAHMGLRVVRRWAAVTGSSYLWICICICICVFVYLCIWAHMGLRVVRRWAAVAGSWPNLPQQWLLRGEASYIAETEMYFLYFSEVFLWFCRPYFWSWLKSRHVNRDAETSWQPSRNLKRELRRIWVKWEALTKFPLFVGTLISRIHAEVLHKYIYICIYICEI